MQQMKAAKFAYYEKEKKHLCLIHFNCGLQDDIWCKLRKKDYSTFWSCKKVTVQFVKIDYCSSLEGELKLDGAVVRTSTSQQEDAGLNPGGDFSPASLHRPKTNFLE